MKVLLLKDVKALGKKGEIKEVKGGYGQNFLVAKGHAINATHEVIKKYEASERRKVENEAKELKTLNQLAKQLDKLKISLHKKSGKNGHLFGAITKDDIAHALLEQHKIQIDKKHINSRKAIKTVGDHDLDFKLGHGLHAVLHIQIIGDK